MKEHFSHAESAEVVAELDVIARRHGGREQVFHDFLTLTVCALAGGTMEDEYLRTVAPYIDGQPGQRDIDRFARLLAKVVALMEATRADILGDVFEGAITRGQNGQYLTPESLGNLMASLVGEDSGSVNDPCCGTGRLLLAAATVNRHRYFVGQDIDIRCVKITALNLALWDLYGRVIWGNSLTNDRCLVYETGFNGKGVIRVVAKANEGDAPSTLHPGIDVPEGDRATPANGSPAQRTLFEDE